jgi:uncharacterized protein (DUF433 family)
MPEDRDDREIRQLLAELLNRSLAVEETLRTICRALLESPFSIQEVDQAGRIVYRVFPGPLPPEDWARLVASAKERLPAPQPRERTVEPWRHLVARPHPWRRQLYVKGRNMTVRQLVGTVKANRFTPEQAAEDLELPVEAIHEALQYAEKHKDLLESDAAYERHLLAHGGQKRGAQPVP